MDLRKLSDTFTVSFQITPDDVPAIAAAGFRAIMCNRPDGEEPWQSDAATIAEAAQTAGLVFRAVPIISGSLSMADLADFNAAVAELPAPVLAYCRTGTRCTMLWSVSQIGQMPEADIVATAAEAGYDMQGVVAQMSRQLSGKT